MLKSMIAAAIVMLVAVAPPTFADEVTMHRTITLSGHGEVRLVPDVATVTAGVLSQGATAAEALSANSVDMVNVMDALKAAGIADKDIQTSNFNVMPRYDYTNDGRTPRLSGYDVSNTVTLTLRKLDTLGEVLDQLVKAGANQINGVHFANERPEEALDETRKLAIADARRKADIYASAGAVSIGKVLSISEGAGYQPPGPVVRARMMAAEAAAPNPPISSGEQVLAVDVQVVWELQ